LIILNNPEMFLTRWNYTKTEWKNFLKWRSRRKGLLFYLLQKLGSGTTQNVPEVRITADRVWVNDRQEPFQNRQRQFREIRIREAGVINILEISYEQGNSTGDIRVLIPKGRLKEAFEVQEWLSNGNRSVG